MCAAPLIWMQMLPPRSIIHVDMDAFYASVEQRDDPALRGRPIVVGGHARRGVVLAASYEARPFGVHSAMPMARALQLLPRHAVVVPPRFEAYVEASERIFAIFESVTPLVEALSLDEAFLDVTGSRALFGPAATIAARIRAQIASELSLPASAGIAAVKMVAKIASDLAKPNGQVEVQPGETERFLAPLPVRRLWGVGPKQEERLRLYGLRTLGDLAARTPEWLEEKLGASGRELWALARGIDERPVVPDREAKSIGAEDTFAEDISAREELAQHLHSQAVRVGRRLRRAGARARTIQVKLKSSTHRLRTVRLTLDVATDDDQEIFRAALELLDRAAPAEPVRLTGVSVSGLDAAPEQLPLLDGGARRARRLNETLDRIADRFGVEAVRPADLIEIDSGTERDELRRRGGAARIDVAAGPGPRSRPRRRG